MILLCESSIHGPPFALKMKTSLNLMIPLKLYYYRSGGWIGGGVEYVENEKATAIVWPLV